MIPLIVIKQFNIIVIISLLCIINLAIIGIFYYYHDFIVIYGQTTDITNNPTNNKTNLDNNSPKQVEVGDINVSYTIRSEGDPILLIMGYSGSKYDWDPILLKELSANRQVIVFDNRGVSNSTLGTKNYTINQLAEDAKGLLNALGIRKADVLGYSMGGMIAQELTLKHPDKVDDLIIYATHCGPSDLSFYPPEELRNKFGNLNGTEEEIKNRFVPYQFPDKWKKQNSLKYNEIFESFKLPSIETLQKQKNAMFDWIKMGGSCDQLRGISTDTLIVAGTEDQIIPSKNSLLLVQKIPGAWLAQFKEGGHALMFQYPERLSEIINTFLANN